MWCGDCIACLCWLIQDDHHKLWKDNGSLNHGMHFQVLQEKKAGYRCVLRSFLTEEENENISHLCNAADVSKKLLWSMLKSHWWWVVSHLVS